MEHNLRDGDRLPVESPWKAPKEISVRELDFEHFKNRYGMDDKYHIIEVLMATPQTADEIKREMNRQRDGREQKLNPLEEDKNKLSDSEWIEQIRIQSPIILGYLNHVAGDLYLGWDIERSWVFFQPFVPLSFLFPCMKQHLDALEERWREVVQLEDAGNFEDASAKQKNIEIEREAYRNGRGGKQNGIEIKRAASRDDGRINRNVVPPVTYDGGDSKIIGSDAGDDVDKNLPSEEGGNDIDISDPRLDNPTALRHMRCYIKFVEQEILSLEQKFRAPLGGKIRSNDLQHLFQLGDLIYYPSNSISRQQTIFIVNRKTIKKESSGNPNSFGNFGLTLYCYYADNDGESYISLGRRFNIEGYEGERAITDLAVYPLRFMHDYEQRRTELRKQGEHFMAMVREKHVYCQSWTLPGVSVGIEGKAEETKYSPPEYVESDVIIDIKEAMNQNSEWKIGYGLSGKGRSTAPAGLDDIVNKGGKLIRFGALLLPRRFLVYVLRERRFASVDVMTMEKIPPQETIFDDLRIDPDNKRMVKSLVAAHFQKRELQKNRPGISSMNQDLIRGKGSGLFILLHGVPGVGKTATAEAVAQANGKPLFAITCGDLGFTPREVEEELSRIFRLANKWDCVLLLDEADVFLARRDTWNLKRNAVVSGSLEFPLSEYVPFHFRLPQLAIVLRLFTVLLRVLEYYSGILFLTTNRVGTMDEAFKSRIHITLYFEPLARDQTVKIFWINIEKLKKMEHDKEKRLKESGLDHPKLKIKAQDIAKWALDYYDTAGVTNDSVRWNGRQIRNAFQIASSLARYDTAEDALGGETVPRPVLGSRHFSMVAKAIEKFDTYMQHATGMADADHARIEGTRADELRFSREPPSKSSYTAAASWKRDAQLKIPRQPRVRGRGQVDKRPVRASRQQENNDTGPSSSRGQARVSEYPRQSRVISTPSRFGRPLKDT
ncbi:hypothetical protein ACHAQJ_004177 [Trichoderma viride]